jgi:hypothetical protein
MLSLFRDDQLTRSCILTLNNSWGARAEAFRSASQKFGIMLTKLRFEDNNVRQC